MKNDMTLIPSKIKHDDSVDLEKLAKMTVGFSGADLQNMVNRVSNKVIFSKGLIGISVYCFGAELLYIFKKQFQSNFFNTTFSEERCRN